MIDQKLARLRTHRSNISRSRRLLKTPLTDCEPEFIERRVAFEALAADTFPLIFDVPGYPEPSAVQEAA